ncbi:hypothetical protein LCGC14_1620110 [marine sediment metagenome]|uniref:Uncharacterized protein n=1 Tax=marine sediment metagenome TaxID=412755 RepID=A0A0F9ISK8_9ZZZZ
MNNVDDQNIHVGGDAGTKTEYFCTVCLQLRLSLIKDKSFCYNCGSAEIITGNVGELDKPALLKYYGSLQD